MRSNNHWRLRPASKRLRLATALSQAEDTFRAQSIGRARECYNFFADFWESTPHPFAQMALVVGWAIIVVTVNDDRVLEAGIMLDEVAGKAVTTILAFLIVFRTNQSYNRWWEGRILWGKMHWSCVELTQQAATWIENRRLAIRVMNFAITFAYTVKQILRREKLHADDLDGILDPAEVERINRMSMTIMPYYCTDVMRQCIKKGLAENPQSFGVQAVARGMDIPVSQLSVQFADMARVRNTPQPDCFRVMLHMFTVIYLLLLPVISYNSLGLWVVPEVLLTSYLMLGLQLAATHLEDPFGYDLTDLELDLFVDCIADQCRAAFYVGEKSGKDLTLDDGGAQAECNNNNDNDHGGGRTGGGSGALGTDKGSNDGSRSGRGGRGGRRGRGRGAGGGYSGGRIGDTHKSDRGEGDGGGGGCGGGGGGEGSPSTGWQTSPSLVASAPPSVSPSGSEAVFVNGGGGGDGSGGGGGGRERGTTAGDGGSVSGRSPTATRKPQHQQTPLGGSVAEYTSDLAGAAAAGSAGAAVEATGPVQPPARSPTLSAARSPTMSAAGRGGGEGGGGGGTGGGVSLGEATSGAPFAVVPDFCVPPSPDPSTYSMGTDRGRTRERHGERSSSAAKGSSSSKNGGSSSSKNGGSGGSSGSGGGSHGGAFVQKLSIRYRAREDEAPRRRSKSRPGRGKAPLVGAAGGGGSGSGGAGTREGEAMFVSPTAPDMNQYQFEHRRGAAAMQAEVV